MATAETDWGFAPRASRPRALVSAVRRFVRSSPVGAASAAFLLFVLLVAIFADLIAPFDPLEGHYDVTRTPPGADWLAGTDHLGRDVLSRLIFGARVTMIVAVSSVVLGDSIGFAWGILSGYIGGRFDLISQRVLDVLLSFPGIILALLLLVSLGSGLQTVIIAIAVTRVPGTTRLIRSVSLSVREFAYVEAARASGASPLRIMVRHVAPQAIAPLLVIGTLNLGAAIFAEAALSFLGVGIPPPAPSWGNMLGGVLAEAFRPPWWMVMLPGVAITLTILAANLFGDALRDFLDPTMKRQIESA